MDTRQAEIVDKIHFAVMAIEASAKEMRISPMEMRRRLEKVGCHAHPKSEACSGGCRGGLAKLGSRRIRR